VSPTISGVIVERRDQGLITGGRCPPERAFSTAFTMPLSMNGPFLTERAISLHFRLPIADCRLPIADCQFPIATPPKILPLPIADLPIADFRLLRRRRSSIGNWQSAIGNHFVLRSFRIIFCVRLLLRVL